MTGTRGLSVTAQWLATITLPWPAAQATMLDARGAIDALVSPPRRAGARDRRAAARLAVGGAGRAVALPARDRHADRGRAVRRDRRLRAVRQSRAADELRRAGPVQRSPPASSAGSGRSPRPGPGTPDGCWSRPPGTTAKRPAIGKALTDRQAGQPPEAIAIAWSAQRRLHRTWTRLEKRAPSAARSSRSPPPASSPGSAGRSPKSSNPTPEHNAHPVGWVGGGPARAGNPRYSYEQPAPTRAGHARS